MDFAISSYRKSEEILYTINSKDRNSLSTSSSDFVIDFKLPVTSLKCRKARLVECVIPNTIYNVVTSVNDRLDFIADGTPGYVTLPQGNYSISLLCSTLQTLLNAASSNFTVTVSTTTFFITIARSSGTLGLPFATGANFARSVHPNLGFASTDLTAATSYTGTIACQLVNDLSLYILCTEFSCPNRKSNNSVYTYKISLSGQSGDYITHLENSSFVQEVDIRDPNFYRIAVKLTNERGNVVNLLGGEWQFTVKLLLEN